MPEVSIYIPADHPSFAGHFPGMPITPGVVLLDQAIYAIARDLQLDLQACTVNSVKFLHPVLPDAQLSVHYDVGANGNIRFDIKDNQDVAATGVFHV
jgi:3-hydroxymyristoyl/3-hydroxydecanoyl-(acyl carrier protein) dehydratase